MQNTTRPTTVLAAGLSSLLLLLGCNDSPNSSSGSAVGTDGAPSEGSGPESGPSGGDATATGDPEDDTSDGDDDGGAETGSPEPEGEGPSEFPVGRRIRRMTADQYIRSLTVATGQSWPLYEDYAAALGKADFAGITSDDRSLSVTFDKFIHDAAQYTCRTALDDDVTNGGATILREVGVEETDEDALRRNLQYLMLRFLAVSLPTDDPRLDPWLGLLTAGSTSEITDAVRQERWSAVCVGLATHVDFVTY